MPVARKLRADRSGAETKSFCPCQKSQVSLLRYLTFSLVCGRIWQRGTAAPCAVRVGHRRRSAACGGCSEAGMAQRSAIGKAALPPQTEPGTARGLAKQVQVRPSIFAMLWGSCPPFSLLCSVLSHPASSASNRCYPLQHPERTRFRPFLAFSGAFFSFLAFCDRKISALVFVHPAA